MMQKQSRESSIGTHRSILCVCVTYRREASSAASRFVSDTAASIRTIAAPLRHDDQLTSATLFTQDIHKRRTAR